MRPFSILHHYLLTTLILASHCAAPSSPGTRKGNGTSPTANVCLHLESETGEPMELLATVGFNDTIKNLFATSCASCHSGSLDPDLTQYVTSKAAIAGIIRTMKLAKGQRGVMPPAGPLGAEKVKLVEDWKAAGMPEKDSGTAPSTGQTKSSGPTKSAGTTCKK